MIPNVVDNYSDFQHLLRPWNNKPFGCRNVIPKVGWIGLDINIFGYTNFKEKPKKFDSDKERLQVNSTEQKSTKPPENITPAEKIFLEEVHGVVEVERIGLTNKLTAKVKSIKHFEEAIRYGVQLIDGKKTVKPKIQLPQQCKTCADWTSYHKPCTIVECLNCGKGGHTEVECNNRTECKHCHGSHHALDKNCPVYQSKLIKLNDLIASVLVGEGVLRHKGELVRYAYPDVELTMTNTTNQTNINDVKKLVIEEVTKQTKPIQESIESVKQSALETDKRIRIIESNFETITESVSSLREDNKIINKKIETLTDAMSLVKVEIITDMTSVVKENAAATNKAIKLQLSTLIKTLTKQKKKKNRKSKKDTKNSDSAVSEDNTDSDSSSSSSDSEDASDSEKH